MKKTVFISLLSLSTFLAKPQGANNMLANYLMNNVNVALPCPPNATFYDSGGNAGQYANSENFTKTFSVPAGNCLQVSFTAFSTESCCDRLYIFDGPTGASPLIGIYNGLSSPGTINSSGTSLTFSFTSDGSVTDIGWVADMSCIAPCSGVPAGGSAVASPATGCAAYVTTLTAAGGAAGCSLSYQWQSAAVLGGPYVNIGGATAPTCTQNVGSNICFRRITTCGASSGTSVPVCVTMGSVVIPCSLASYAPASIVYSYDNFVGTATPTGDDNLYNGFSAFGFPFCFNGQSFGGGYIGSNCEFVFDGAPCFPNIYPMPGGVYAAAGQATGWSISLPAPTNADYTPRNAILCPWQDLYMPAGGTIKYTVIGVTPNRRFVVSWENVAMYSCNSTSCTSQLKLFETTNNIEIHVQTKNLCPTWNSGQAILGLHSFDGAIYIPPVNMVAHNAPTQWTMTNTAYRFTTSCPSQSVCGVVLPIGFKSFSGQQIDGVNKLFWETSEETNVKEFVVERSLDGANFQPINLTSSENKPSMHTYSDNTFERGFINYYKITANNNDGSKVSTTIYAVYSTDDKVVISSIYPNPATEKLSININGRGANADCSFIIYDQVGRVVVKKDQSVAMGSNQVNVDIANLEKGIYFIEISAGAGTIISKQKFSKQ